VMLAGGGHGIGHREHADLKPIALYCMGGPFILILTAAHA